MHETPAGDFDDAALRRLLDELGIPFAIGTDPGILEALAKHFAPVEPALAEALRRRAFGRATVQRALPGASGASVPVTIQDRTDGMTYVLSLAGVPMAGDVLVVRHPSGGVSLWALRVLEVGADGTCVAECIGGVQSAHAIFDAHPVPRGHEKDFA